MDTHASKDKDFHAEIAHVYDYLTVEPREYANQILFKKLLSQIPKGDLAIDLGCGTGHMLLRLQHLFDSMIGVDHSAEMLHQARQKIRGSQANIELVESDLDEFLKHYTGPQPNFVSCVGVLHHLQQAQLQKFLENLFHQLAPTGMLLVAEPIFSNSIPNIVDRLNRRSVVPDRLKESMPPNAVEPDEEPLDEEVLLATLETSGFDLIRIKKGIDIFPEKLPVTLKDKLIIQLINLVYSKKGDVIALLAGKK